ncbi:class I SAM-dependent methyltransferase [Bacteriovoracales bacterium]|nr:class I SAM-dependent methyltransferase [Bacteriovoracales bacterium]
MEFESKILSSKDSEENTANKEWWEDNPMIYDWDKNLGEIKHSNEYFKNIDNIFGQGHSLINNPNWPEGFILENFIPYHKMKSKKVLEIGCGAGLVSSHISINGAELTAIDLTKNAINLTKHRFSSQNLKGDILQMDAESMNFEENSFDIVVSWGVIHHSGNMKKIIDEIRRILKPNGEAYLMVYNKNSLRYKVYCPLWLGIMRGKFFKMNLSEIAGSITDGHIARHLTEDEFKKLSNGFKKVSFSYSDEVKTTSGYLMGPFSRLLKFLPARIKNKFEHFLARKWGWYMEIKLVKGLL